MLSIAVATVGFATAQIKNDKGTFTKPTAGSTIVEISLLDLTGGGLLSLPTASATIGQLGVKARKFVSDKKAYRFIANVEVKNNGGATDKTDFAVAIGAGVENHMTGAERLSTYWGYEGQLGFIANENNLPKSTSVGVAANVFTGFDYYIVPNVYLGAEISYGLGFKTTSYSAVDGPKQPTENAIRFAPGINPSFRLGWRF